MSNLEFKAWDKKKKMWTNFQIKDNMFYFMDKNTGVWIRDDNFERFELVQYSGFEDKDKTKIYKGDILYNDDFDCAFEVVWDEDCGFWAADIVDDGGREMLNEYIDCTACIIGNIYDEVGD